MSALKVATTEVMLTVQIYLNDRYQYENLSNR